ncbi:MAG: KamA family radical SAM protein [Magnetococcales bacterium]|nr:KamA family radical SAM protein [Magnetococcales bacterium]
MDYLTCLPPSRFLLHPPVEIAGAWSREEQRRLQQFPFLMPQKLAEAVHWQDENDPLRRQFLPTAAELVDDQACQDDPLAEQSATPLPGLIHKYRGRVLLLLTQACAVHCRYCFRRQTRTTSAPLPHTLEQWQPALRYIACDSSIQEVILSGGDPLMVPNRLLIQLTEALSAIPHVGRIRIHSRVPVVWPERVDADLLGWLSSITGHERIRTFMVLHVNHGRELTESARYTLAKLADCGLLLLNQSVLLRGVNDDRSVLVALSEQLLTLRILPYYLHLLDPVTGAGHFAVPEQHARQLLAQMQADLPGYGVPRLVRERPGAAAKVLYCVDDPVDR